MLNYKNYAQATYTYLQDSILLKKIDEMPIKEQYVRIIVLDNDDFIEEYISGEWKTIQGYVTSGNINVDGKSAVRRTGSFQMVATDDNYRILDPNNIISIKTRFALEVGFKNNLPYIQNESSVDYFWFPLGVFVATGCSITRNNNGWNISLSFKDKMAYLNGELGGKFPADVRLDKMEVWDTTSQSYLDQRPLVKDIVISIVEIYGGIKTIAEYIEIEEETDAVLAWYGNCMIHLLEANKGTDEPSDNYANFYLNYAEADAAKKDIPAEYTTKITSFEYGEDIGYQRTRFTYPDKQDLIAAAGSTVTSILDKIKGLVNNFEYFFDVYGDFHFQPKRDMLFTNSAEDVEIINSAYSFTDATLITAFSCNPQYLQIKNDFVVQGERQVDGIKKVIRYHFVFDDKPLVNSTEVNVIKSANANGEIIFTGMAETGTESSIAFIPTHYLEMIYIDSLKPLLQRNPAWEKYHEEVRAFLPSLIDLSKSTEERRNLWAYLENDHSDKVWWLEFQTTAGLLEDPYITSLDIKDINRRPEVIKETNVNRLMEDKVPPYTIINGTASGSSEVANETVPLGVPANIAKGLALGGSKRGAAEYLRSILHKNISYNEAITVTSIPIYHFEPNTVIQVEDDKTNINGYYLINSFSLPLDTQGTMNIQCSKALQMLTKEEE